MTPKRPGPDPDYQKRARVVLLYEEDGLNCAEIGRRLGITRQAVRQMLLRSGKEVRSQPIAMLRRGSR